MLASLKSNLPAVAGVAAAGLLFMSPLLFGLAGTAAQSAYLLGAVAIALKLKPLWRPQFWDTWMVAAIGAIVIATPWLVPFADIAAATWIHLVSGSVLAVTAFSPLRLAWNNGASVQTGPDTGKPEGPAEPS